MLRFETLEQARALAARLGNTWKRHRRAQRAARRAARTAVVASALVGMTVFAAAAAQGQVTEWNIEHGRALFVRSWQPYDEQTPHGDGLGPMYNAQSCADCHHQGGVGGGGPAMHNVQLLCLIPPERKESLDRKKRAMLVEGIGKIHPALVTRFTALPAITLHKFGENPAYDKWRSTLEMLVGYLPPGEVPERIGLRLAQRNTPALFGAGLIDAIPDEVLEKEARRQKNFASGVRGKLAPATGGGVGKFGWRGQTASLKQFVMGACANELGLVVPENDQPLDPLEPDHKSPGLDLDQEQCDQLVVYVASLPPPEQRLPMDDAGKEAWGHGAKLFERVGCAECHVPKLGEVAGIYSDLLLHDMGEFLADSAAANSPGQQPLPSSSTPQYYGGPQDVFASLAPETMRQWRTPPLWGVADSAPYMHDGRAETLDDAILLHDGEATRARQRYEKLSIKRRQWLLAYLDSLGYAQP